MKKLEITEEIIEKVKATAREKYYELIDATGWEAKEKGEWKNTCVDGAEFGFWIEKEWKCETENEALECARGWAELDFDAAVARREERHLS